MAVNHTNPRTQLLATERQAEIVDLVREGYRFTEIAEMLGITKQAVHQLFNRALSRVLSPAVEALRAQHLAETATARETAIKVMGKDHVAHSQGRIMIDPETEQPLIDDGPKLDAARTLIAVQAREAKLVGADAPTKVEASVEHSVDPDTIELRNLIAEQHARNEAERAGLAEDGDGGQPA